MWLIVLAGFGAWYLAKLARVAAYDHMPKALAYKPLSCDTCMAGWGAIAQTSAISIVMGDWLYVACFPVAATIAFALMKLSEGLGGNGE